MPRKQRSELTAGLFTVGALVLLIGVVFWLGAADVFKPRGQKTYFYVDQSSGRLALKSGGQVLINDVVVGKITDVATSCRFTAGISKFTATARRRWRLHLSAVRIW